MFEKAERIVLKLGVDNAVTYDMSKTEAVIFSKARQQKFEQLLKTRLRVDIKTILFKKEPTQWLRVWLDSRLNFSFHINERMKKAKTTKAQIKVLSKTYGLCLGLV